MLRYDLPVRLGCDAKKEPAPQQVQGKKSSFVAGVTFA
jgi:hypothetical protein